MDPLSSERAFLSQPHIRTASSIRPTPRTPNPTRAFEIRSIANEDFPCPYSTVARGRTPPWKKRRLQLRRRKSSLATAATSVTPDISCIGKATTSAPSSRPETSRGRSKSPGSYRRCPHGRTSASDGLPSSRTTLNSRNSFKGIWLVSMTSTATGSAMPSKRSAGWSSSCWTGKNVFVPVLKVEINFYSNKKRWQYETSRSFDSSGRHRMFRGR